ncbi:MAG: hypothetical protein LBR81_03570 [Prevotellaceae bacterium]|jgi:Flp pilus assembly protein protease CpaA|nr:hypothetical protein [Prevotellaceae bacterium]
MELALNMVIVLLLAALIYQDFKSRSVLWVIFPVLIIFQFFLSYKLIGWDELWRNTVVNLMLLALQFLLLTLYFSFRNARWTNIINKYIGAGDVFFFVFLSLAFSPFNFIAFFVVSLLAILIIYFLIVRKNLKKHKIPLLGAMSIAYLPVLCVEYLSDFNKFDDVILNF